MTDIAATEEIVEALRRGHMIVLVDQDDRENEGDLLIAADCVNAQAINFMAKYARGLICLTLTREHCERLALAPMVHKNASQYGTNFTQSIEAAEGVSTGISAADRAHTIKVAVAKHAQASSIVSPGHVFPLQAHDGGVLARAGHTEAGCDLAALAGFTPAAVICEIMKDDGTMARLPDLIEFAKLHQMKIGSIANLIQTRNREENLVKHISTQKIHTFAGDMICMAFQDQVQYRTHLALLVGKVDAHKATLVRVHEPCSLVDLLEMSTSQHSWSLATSMRYIVSHGNGVIVLLNAGDNPEQLLTRLNHLQTTSQQKPLSTKDEVLRTYGIGAQILRHLGVTQMRVLGQERPIPSMHGFGLSVCEFIHHPDTVISPAELPPLN